MAAVLLSVSVIWQRRLEGRPATPETVEGVGLMASASPSYSPPAATAPSQATPVTYTVQSGDTLSVIAQTHDVSVEELTAANDLVDPNLLRIGQVLIIPQGEPEDLEAPLSTETPVGVSREVERQSPQLPMPTPSGPPLVEISEAVGVGNLDAEAVVLRNEGGIVNLEGWTLSSGTAEAFVLPALTLFTGGGVSVHSAQGDDTPRDLYWGRTEPAWQAGKLIALRDAEGNVVDTYVITER
jgi:LysM repeat protein